MVRCDVASPIQSLTGAVGRIQALLTSAVQTNEQHLAGSRGWCENAKSRPKSGLNRSTAGPLQPSSAGSDSRHQAAESVPASIALETLPRAPGRGHPGALLPHRYGGRDRSESIEPPVDSSDAPPRDHAVNGELRKAQSGSSKQRYK